MTNMLIVKYAEDWSEGLIVYHNPSAAFSCGVPASVQIGLDENGNIVPLIPENYRHPFASRTLIFAPNAPVEEAED
jgi:hypothetical protein